MVLWWVLVHCVRPECGHYFNVEEKTREPRTKKKNTQKNLKITQTKQKEELGYLTKDYGKCPQCPKGNF
jgi:hypothetical protein